MFTLRTVIAVPVLMLAALAASAAAEQLMAGSWALKITSPQGTLTPLMTLVQDGNRLSGTYKGMNGEAPIAGTLTGNAFDLPVKVQSADVALVIEYKGEVSGDTLTGKVMMGQFGEASFTGSRTH